MKRTTIIIVFTIIQMTTITANAQQEVKHRKGFMIKYDLISLLGDQVSNSMGVRLGFEMLRGTDQAVAADIMYVFPCRSCGQAYTTIETEATVGFMVSGEYRFYLFPGKNAFSGFHVGPQLAYQYTRSEMNETYGNGMPNSYYVYRNQFGIHGMAGYQLGIAGPLYIDPALGLGFRYINSRHEDKLGNDPGQHEFPYDKDFESGARWFPGFDISIKIGLKL